MNKQAFLNELRNLTGGLNEGERSKLLEYYEEMIDDRVEEGIAEEEAVAAMGSPADIAREFAPAAKQDTAKGDSQAVDALRSLRRVLPGHGGVQDSRRHHGEPERRRGSRRFDGPRPLRYGKGENQRERVRTL